jgi:ATP-binding cassette subfamily B protein
MPEVVQTSAMDCGPACLAALLAGHGIDASYGRLREACQTDVDGTSIDTIEEAAVQLGLDAEQTIIPVDHVLLDEAEALPALAVVRLPSGDNHFIVIWGRTGRRVHVMDPAVGRRRLSRKLLLDDLYVHEMDVPLEAWREWAGSESMRRPLARRLREVGVSAPGDLIDRALADPGWKAIAALDAATRMAQHLIDAGALRAGATAAQLLTALLRDDQAIPEDMWSARAATEPDQLRVRGAVLVTVSGHTANTEPASAELRAALHEPPLRPWRHLAAALVTGRPFAPLTVLSMLVASALLTVVQAVLWRAMFDAGELTTVQIAGAVATLVAFLFIELFVERALIGTIQRLGRRVELGLRAQFLASIGRLGLRYLRSRPTSDMAERSHALFRLGELPSVGARVLRVSVQAVLTGIALIWLAPEATWLVVLLALAVVVPPLVGHRPLAEAELRLRTHHGALARFYLDALLGSVPASVHGAERAIRREHEARLTEWVRAARREHALAHAIDGLQTALVSGLAIWLVAAHALATNRPASVLLLIYWTIGLATHGATLARLVRELPIHRNLTLRLLEPLGARGEDDAADGGNRRVGDAAIAFDGVTVVAAGHTILSDVTLAIRTGEHVAVVGRSGAGKSTLLGLLLGWHRPAAGSITIDGEPLDGAMLAALRPRTAWLDPAVQLWNDSLASNLSFGTRGDPDLGATVVAAQLESVLARLPEGLQTGLGEGGGLVSGGEGQRVRFGRALLRPGAALVVLDEPFRGLDRERRRELLDTARAHWRGATLLCATHDLAETRTFDRVVVIDQGRIVEDGVPSELATRKDSRYSALLAEEAALATLWARWRGAHLDAGRVVEP